MCQNRSVSIFQEKYFSKQIIKSKNFKMPFHNQNKNDFRVCLEEAFCYEKIKKSWMYKT